MHPLSHYIIRRTVPVILKNESGICIKSFGINLLKGSAILEITLPFILIIITLKLEKIRRK